MHIIDYLYQYEKRIVSPICERKKHFDFLCLGYLEIAESLGFSTYQATPKLRMVEENTIVTDEDLEFWISSYSFDYSYFRKEVEKLIEMKANNLALTGGGCFGPLTVASSILGTERLLKYIVKKPNLVKKFVDIITKHIIELAKLEREKIDFFWVAEPIASLLPPKRFWEFSGVYLKNIFDSALVPGILHVCGKTLYHTKYLAMTGAEVLSIDYLTDMLSCLRMVDEKTVIMGNISPINLKEGTYEEIKAEILGLNEECKNYKNVIISTGCSVIEGTPEENFQGIFEITHDYPCRSNKEFYIIRQMINFLDKDMNEELLKFIEENSISDDLISTAKYESKCRKELLNL